MTFFIGNSQSNNFQNNLSPNGVLDNVFDQYGNHYTLNDLVIDKQDEVITYQKSALLNCSSTSYFNLYFEIGSGFENVSDPVQNAINVSRREVVCKVFEDLSNFISSPLTGTGNKVNIWVRNINNISGVSSLTLGLATAFYNLPSVSNTSIGGIADSEIWKTIHLGVDSYANVTQPLVPSGINSNASGIFYHGMMAFNFNSAINWNTDLGIATPSDKFDLYTVVLHEVSHALGFASLINENGNSKAGTNFRYYNRYDTFLKTNSNEFLLTTPLSSCSTFYNNTFNSNLSASVLRPNCTTIDNLNIGAPLNATICADAIYYGTIPVYTPTCFETASSLSHFEDQLYPSCSSHYVNDSYFVMSNATNIGATKRYFKPEERNVLCDLGYTVATSFGSSSTYQGLSPANYYGNSVCQGITVAGVIDGITYNGPSAIPTYTFIGSGNIDISGAILLGNDSLNVNGFECLQDMSVANASLSSISITSGTATDVIHFSSNIAGLHLLRYIPINSFTNQKGNITYVYVYVQPSIPDTASCNPTPNLCNLVMNGDFEQKSANPSQTTQIQLACGWDNAMNTTDYFNTVASGNVVKIPCNGFGYQDSNLATGGNGYAGLAIIENKNLNLPHNYEILKTKLLAPLAINTTYQLTFDVSLAEGYSSSAAKLQAYLSTTNFISNNFPYGNGDLPITNQNMLQTNTTFSTNSSDWETITLTFTTGNTAGEQYLYIGGLNLSSTTGGFLPKTPANQVIGCAYSAYNIQPWASYNMCYYYIDNVLLIPLNNVIFNLPPDTCSNQIINLNDYVTNASPQGHFSGVGVTGTNFSVATAGSYLVKYTYPNSLGCLVELTDTIIVNVSPPAPTFNQAFSIICQNQTINLNSINATNSSSSSILTWHTATPATAANTIANTVISQNSLVYASFQNTTTGCFGSTKEYNVYLAPSSGMLTPPNRIVCKGDSVIIPLIGCNITSYSWIVSGSSTGLTAGTATNNQIFFIAQNTTSNPRTANVTVTPYINSVAGTPVIFSITVNPSISITSNPIATYTTCSGSKVNSTDVDNTITINPATFSNTPVIVTGYNWSIDNPTLTQLISGGQVPSSGTGMIPPFNVVNTTSAQVVLTITYTPIAPSGYCSVGKTIAIKIDPMPRWASEYFNLEYCSGDQVNLTNFASINPSDAAFTWTNSNTAIGLAASSGISNLTTFFATNTTSSNLVSTITVNATKGTCSMPSKTFTITVKPRSQITNNTDANPNNNLANIMVCSGANISIPAFESNVLGTTYTWTITNPTITNPAFSTSGEGNIPVFFILNTASSNVVWTVTVTPKANYCIGNSVTFTIMVLPPVPNVVTFPDSATITSNQSGPIFLSSGFASVVRNDRLNGVVNPPLGAIGTLGSLTLSLVYVALSASPTVSIANSGITLDTTTGQISVASTVPVGVYKLKYSLCSNACTATPVCKEGIVTITINQVTISTPKGTSLSGICYTPTTSYTSSQSIFDGVTIGNVPANGTNCDVNVTFPPNSGLTIDSEGYVTAPIGTLPQSFSFTYTICGASGSPCTGTLSGSFIIGATMVPNQDFAYIGILSNGLMGFCSQVNVLDNDQVVHCNNSNLADIEPAVLGTNVLLNVPIPSPDMPFTINPANGNLIVNFDYQPNSGYLPIISYEICDMTYTSICATNSVTVVNLGTYCSTTKMSYKNEKENKSENNLNNLNIIPNPSNGIFNILFDNKINKATIELYNYLGQLLYVDAIKDEKEKQIDIVNLPSGIYTVKILNDNKVIAKQIIKN